MIPQGAWRRMFIGFRANNELAKLLDSIFTTDDSISKGALIDELYSMNEGQKNRLTGQAGNTINTFRAVYDPFNNLSVISLKDRRALIEFLELPVPFDWEKTPIGFLNCSEQSNPLRRAASRRRSRFRTNRFRLLLFSRSQTVVEAGAHTKAN